MSVRSCRAALAAALVAVSSGLPLAAHAEEGWGSTGSGEPGLASSRDTWTTELTRRPLTLGRGMVEVWFPVSLNASEDRFGEPWHLNPSIYLGLTDRWMIGVRHFVGICPAGDDNGCEEVYDDVSVDTVFSLARAGGLDWALGAALNAAPLTGDPAFAGDVRLIARAGGGALALTVAPTLRFGLNDREGRQRLEADVFPMGTYGLVTPRVWFDNTETLSVPATLQVQLGRTLAVAATAALDGPLDPPQGGFGDWYQVPIGFAAVVTPIPWIDVGASFSWSNLLGKDDTSESRALAFFAAFRY